MLTIMCMVWERDERYLAEFIRHHSDMGISNFLFIIDEYRIPFNSYGNAIPISDAYSIEHVRGISTQHSLVLRQRENYNYYLHRIRTEYVCVIDVDEFLHAKTLNFLKKHKPQSISLPWRMMVYNEKTKKIPKNYLYSGILIPQKKSISKVRDIHIVTEHECTFKYKGKTIGYQNCTHIPISHFYIRDMQDIQDMEEFSSDTFDNHCKSRLSTMALFYVMCNYIYEHQVYINLSDNGNTKTHISDENPNLEIDSINKDSLPYLYAMIKLTIWISILTQIEHIAPPRVYAEICSEIARSSNPASKFLKAIKIIFKIYRNMMRNKESLKSAMIRIYI